MNPNIDFSIIIPTYNRPQQLVSCLKSISLLDYPRDKFELIVVDDGSKISLAEEVEPFQEQFKVILIKQDNAGPAAARNTGSQHARGEYIAFTDDDCSPEKEWLTKLKKYTSIYPKRMIGGQTVNILTQNPFSTMSQNIISLGYKHYNSRPEESRFFTSNNMVVPRKQFIDIGGFNEKFRTAEDRELCDRWVHAGYSTIYIPEIIIYHSHPMSLKQFWQQHFSYGQGAFRFHHKRAEKGWGNFKIEGNYYWQLLLFPFKNMQIKQIIPLTFALGVSQVANAAGFFWEMFLNSKQANQLQLFSLFSSEQSKKID